MQLLDRDQCEVIIVLGTSKVQIITIKLSIHLREAKGQTTNNPTITLALEQYGVARRSKRFFLEHHP